MKVYNTIVQKIINTHKPIYSKTDPLQECKYGFISNDLQNSMSPTIYNLFLQHQLWAKIQNNEFPLHNGIAPIFDTNTFESNLVKQLYYLFIFHELPLDGRLNNCANLIIRKFRFLNKVFENPFNTRSMKEKALSIFSIAQRTYFALVKFVKICKHKLCSVYNNTDILMNPIIRGRPLVIEIYQNNKIYLFTRPDIINIMNAGLSHSPNFFSEPLTIKNPYNNMVFRKSDLYNFYFFLRSGLFIISDLIQQFFLSNFDIYHFKKNNEYIIREYYITNYVENTPTDSLILDIKYMLDTMNISKKIHIHCDFPKDTLIQVMRPYLLLYYKSIYSIDIYKRNACSHELLIRLVKFINFNPRFGRTTILLKPKFRTEVKGLAFKKYKPSYKKTIIFNDAHIPYYNKDQSFMLNQSNIEDSESESDSTVSDV